MVQELGKSLAYRIIGGAVIVVRCWPVSGWSGRAL